MSENAESRGVLQQLVERARQLYSLPSVAMKVLELTDCPDVDTPALKQCLENDPALTAKILRVVNSSLFGLARDVTDLNQALALLGVKPLKLLVLGFSLPKRLFADVEVEVLEHYWRWSLIKAVACREISGYLNHLSGDEAFVAGLLQDIGMLVLVQDLGEPYVRFLERILREGGDLAALETATLGFDHAVLSARLLRHWGLPDSIVQAVGLPHDAERVSALPAPERFLSQALHIADLVAAALTRGRAAALSELQQVVARYGAPTAAQLSSLVAVLEAKVQQLADVLSVRLAEQPDYLRLELTAHALLSDAAEQAAIELPSGKALEMACATEAKTLRAALRRAVRGGEPRDPGAASAARDQAGSQLATAPKAEAAADDPGLLGRVAVAVADCRQARCSVSLAFMDVDHYDSFLIQLGPDGASALIDSLESVIDLLLESPDCCVKVDDARFALIFRDCDRQQGVESAQRVARAVRQWSQGAPQTGGRVVTLSSGLATLALPPRNFPCERLIEAAERCRYAARAAGGDGLKSIHIY